MFGKKATEGNTTIIGRGARFVGTLELEGSVFIEGECEGTVRTKSHLALGSGGFMSGELHGKTVSIAGKVRGSIVADETLCVTSSGAIEGEAFYGKLDVKPGGIIDGRTHQGVPAHGEVVAPVLAASVAGERMEESGVMKASRSASGFPEAGAPRRSTAPGAG